MYVNSWQTINMPETPCISWFEGCHGRRLIVFEKTFIRIRNALTTIREIQLSQLWIQLSQHGDSCICAPIVIVLSSNSYCIAPQYLLYCNAKVPLSWTSICMQPTSDEFEGWIQIVWRHNSRRIMPSNPSNNVVKLFVYIFFCNYLELYLLICIFAESNNNNMSTIKNTLSLSFAICLLVLLTSCNGFQKKSLTQIAAETEEDYQLDGNTEGQSPCAIIY